MLSLSVFSRKGEPPASGDENAQRPSEGPRTDRKVEIKGEREVYTSMTRKGARGPSVPGVL